MRLRQVSDLVEGTVVGQREYLYEPPSNILGMLRLILNNCSEFMKREGIPISQDSIELQKLVFTYPRMAGYIEVDVGSSKEI